MADQGLWFKLWCAALDDPDLDNLPIEDFGRWSKLGAFLKRHGEGGVIQLTPPARGLCTMFQVSDFVALLGCLRRLPGVVVQCETSAVAAETVATVSVPNWRKYQGDLSTHRVRRARENQRSRGEERRREETRRDEKRLSPLEVPPAAAPTLPGVGFTIDAAILEALDRLKLFRSVAKFRDPDWWQSMILAFPRIDHLEALSEAHGYLLSSRKKYSDLPAFVRNSFKRAQEQADA